MMKMGVGALAFAALDAFGSEAMEYVQDDQVKVRQLYIREGNATSHARQFLYSTHCFDN